MALIPTINAIRFQQFQKPSSSANQEEAIVLDGYHYTQALITEVTAVGGSAGALLKSYPASEGMKTTVKNAVAATSDTTIELVGDSGVNNTLNGITITTNDFVLIKLDSADQILGAWQLFSIGTLGSTAGEIDINSITTRNGTTGLRAAAAAGNTAYIIRAGKVGQVPVGAATINRQNFAVGEPGVPLAIGLLAGGATAHYMLGTAAYVPVL